MPDLPEPGAMPPRPLAAGHSEADGVFDREGRAQVAAYLRSHMGGRVALDLWTRQASPLLVPGREPCTFCPRSEQMARALASLHPGLSLTRYDIDRHADRAREAGVERPPTLVVRGRGGHVHFTGLVSGALFPAFLDALLFASTGDGGLAQGPRQRVEALEQEHLLEVFVAPYDPFSAFDLRLAAAIGAQQRKVRVRVTEVAEFPQLAASMGISRVPVLQVDGVRLVGLTSEEELVEQLARADRGDRTPVERQQEKSLAYRSLEDIQRSEAASGGQQRPQ